MMPVLLPKGQMDFATALRCDSLSMSSKLRYRRSCPCSPATWHHFWRVDTVSVVMVLLECYNAHASPPSLNPHLSATVRYFLFTSLISRQAKQLSHFVSCAVCSGVRQQAGACKMSIPA